MPIIDTNKKFIEITIGAEDRMLTKELNNPAVGYFDSPYSFLVERIEGASEEETLKLSKDRFLGQIARGAAIPDMMAFEREILIGMSVANGNKRAHLMMADPGVGKTYELDLLKRATGWNALQVDATKTFDADAFFIEDVLTDGTSPSTMERLRKALLKGEGVSEQDRQQMLDRLKAATLPMAENGTPDLGSFTDKHWETFEKLAPQLVENYLVKLPQQSAVGSKKGVILEALIEARDNAGAPLLINMDEGNYYKYGAKSREFIAFMNDGNAKEFVVEFQDVNGNNIKERFTREQLKHVQVMITCNKPDRENERNPIQFSDSLESRFQAAAIPVEMGPKAFTHRLATAFMGIPLNTHLNAAQRDGLDGEKLTQYLQDLIAKGMTEEELKMASKAGMANAMLGQAPKVCEGIEHLGTALYEINALLKGDRGDDIREVMDGKTPHMDGRFIQELYNYMGEKINTAGKPQDKNGKPLAGENPYRILDEKGKTVIEFTPQNIGSRAVKGLQLFLDTTFPAHNDKFIEFRQEIGEILARNKVITLQDATARFGIDQRVPELQSKGVGTNNKDETVEALINVVPPRFKSEELAAATDYLYTIIARQYPDMVKDRTAEEFKSAFLTLPKVAALMEQYGLQYDALGKEAPIVIPGVARDTKGLVATLREPEIRIGVEAAKGLANQPEKEAGIRALLLGAMARSEGQPNPLDALFNTKLTQGEITGLAATIMADFVSGDKRNEQWQKDTAELKAALARVIEPFMLADTKPETEAVKKAVAEFFKTNKKSISELLSVDAARIEERVGFHLKELFEKGAKSPQVSGADAPFKIATMMYSDINDLGFRVTRYMNPNGVAQYSIRTDLNLGLSAEATKTLETRGIRVFDLVEEKGQEAFASQVKYQLQAVATQPLGDGAAPDESLQQRRLHALLANIRRFTDIAGPLLDENGKVRDYETLTAKDGAVRDNDVANLATAISATIINGAINPEKATFVYADKVLSSAAEGAQNLAATKPKSKIR